MNAKTIVADRGAPFVTPERVRFALEATWQSHACATAALTTLAKMGNGADQMEVESVLRALLARLIALQDVGQGALNDPDETAERMHTTLFGVESHG